MAEYICKICGRPFNTKSGLSNHISQQPDTHPSLEDYYLKYILGHYTKTRKWNKKIEFIGIFTGYVKKRKRPHGRHKCKVCGRLLPSRAALAIHVKCQSKWGDHPTPEEYYLKYMGGVKGKCKKCGKDTTFMGIFKGYKKLCDKKPEKGYTCFICGEKFPHLMALSVHIGRLSKMKLHPTPENYYVRIMGHEKGICKECGHETSFKNMNEGFYDFCCVMCMVMNEDIRDKRKDTNMERYGYDNPFNDEEIQNHIKRINMEKLGVEYPLESEEFREKLAKKFQDRLERTIGKYITKNR